MKRWISIAIAGLVFGAAATHAAQVGLIKINGAIGPATANYISRAIDLAANQNDECLVIELNTPGGLANSMDDIVQEFYASRVPVVVYVSPEGAMAGSAGVYITLAADVAAMAPHTTIGAAHPVSMGDEERNHQQHHDAKSWQRLYEGHADHRRKTASKCRMGKIIRHGERGDHIRRSAENESD
jgi:membrane-bound ClpP family serine protease